MGIAGKVLPTLGVPENLLQKSTQKNLPGKTDFIIVNAAYTTSHSSCKCNVMLFELLALRVLNMIKCS